MSKSGRLVGLVLVTLALGLLPLLGAQGQESPAESEDKIVFSVGDDNKPDSLNPLVGIESPSYYIWAFSYDLLVDFSQKDLGPAPGLAESWEVSDDGLTWTYHLREGMKWSDGEPITANDVAYTYNRIIDDNVGTLKGYLTLVDEITAVDDLTLEITTTKPTPLMTSIFIYILPEHIWSDISKEEAKTFENVPAVGSGPYTLEESVEGQFVRLEANENHWDGRPEVDEIIYRIFNNPDAAFQALKSGEIDYTYELPANLYQQLESDDAYTAHEAVISSFDEIAFNVGSDADDDYSDMEPHGDGHPALKDLDVRTAMAMAIDKEELVDKVLQGYGTPASAIVTPASAPAVYHWEPTEEEAIPFDPDGANQLLDEAGYEDTDGDGVREMPEGGEPLRFRYFIRSENDDTVKASQFIKGWFEDIGIATDVQALSDNKLTQEILNGEYDLFHWGWFPDPDPDFILSIFTCDQRPPNPNEYRNSDSYYCNPEIDELYEEQKTILDVEQRAEVVHEMQRIIYQDVPYIVLWYDNDLQAYRNDSLSGYLAQPDGVGDLLNNYTVKNLQPVSERSSRSASKGISAGVWIAVVAGIIIVVAVALMVRRRVGDEHRA